MTVPMSLHNVRVDDDLWDAAMARASDDGIPLSTLIRQWLKNYVDGNDMDANAAAQQRTALIMMNDAIDILKMQPPKK